jgi:hypothetical protein
MRDGEIEFEIDAETQGPILTLIIGLSQLLNTPLLQTLGNAVLGVIEPLGMMTHLMLINVEYPLNA